MNFRISYVRYHLGKLSEAIIIEGSRAKSQFACLLSQGLNDLRMTVPLIDRRVSGQKVVVVLAFGIPDMDAFGFGENYRERMITGRQETLRQTNKQAKTEFLLVRTESIFHFDNIFTGSRCFLGFKLGKKSANHHY